VTVGEALRWGAEELAAEAAGRRDAETLLRSVAGWDRAFVLSHEEAALDAKAERAFRDVIARRALGEPVQYITGVQEFWGLPFKVSPAVLIPRPETEHVIEAVLARLSRDAELQIADVGTGSGAIAIALAKDLANASVVATDVSGEALEVARDNAARHAVADRVEFRLCDLLPPDLRSSFDVIASNPPYIADGERDTLAAEVKDFEPKRALFAGPTGLEIYERLLPAAARAIKPRGWLVIEIGAGQANRLREMLSGWSEVETVRDLAGIERVLCARSK
jgi:release factor glutamine methyltransferase